MHITPSHQVRHDTTSPQLLQVTLLKRRHRGVTYTDYNDRQSGGTSRTLSITCGPLKGYSHFTGYKNVFFFVNFSLGERHNRLNDSGCSGCLKRENEKVSYSEEV